jgi:NCS1 family nucleobase:cation symporter-1
VWALVITKGKGDILQGTYVEAKLPRGSKAWACIAGLNAVTGLYSTVSINIPDFARFAKKPKASWAQALAVPVTGTIPIAVAILCAQAAQTAYGQAVYDPASLCKLFGSRAAQFFSAAVFWVATIGVSGPLGPASGPAQPRRN